MQQGIPTTYNDINFRSRLEAAWAAFFDLCGWQWEYEPCDFNGWILDFLLRFPRKPLYIEIKPVATWETVTDEPAWTQADSLVILGVGPWVNCSDGEGTVEFSAIGWCHHVNACDGGGFEYHNGSLVGMSSFGHKTNPLYGLLAAGGWWTDLYDNNQDKPYGNIADHRAIARLWASAKNITQWRRKRG